MSYRKTYEIVGYTYEADTHCLDCATKRFKDHLDSNGFVREYVTDTEGNPIHPIFLGDEFDHTPFCGTCREQIDDGLTGRLDYTWEEEGFRLDLSFDRDEIKYGTRRDYYCYRFFDTTLKEDPLFRGHDFSPSPMYADDMEKMIPDLLSFLSLQVGDTDEEYFKDYTPEQLAWTRSNRCEELKTLQMDMEEARDNV